MSSLYEISENIKQLETLLEQMDEDDATFENVKLYLDSIVGIDLTQKVENIVKFIKNLEANAQMYKLEMERLSKLEKSAKKKAEGLHNYLSTTLSSLGYDYKNKKKIQTSIGTVGFKKNPSQLQIVDISKVPIEWDKPVQREIRKADLLKHIKTLHDLKDVEELALTDIGIKILNNNSSLQIK